MDPEGRDDEDPVADGYPEDDELPKDDENPSTGIG